VPSRPSTGQTVSVGVAVSSGRGATGAARVLAAVLVGTGAPVFGLVTAVTVVVGAAAGTGARTAPSALARERVPPRVLAVYEEAAATCSGLPWTVLAAIGTVESDNGRSDAPGVSSGANASGAEGPMQMLPATFEEYATVGPGGAAPANPYDLVDAAYSAARMLCANGAGERARLAGAVFAYDHDESYVNEVMDLASSFAGRGSAAATALQFALAEVGTPYVWGAEDPGAGFDCSGLVQAAYGAAGVALPRVAEDQFDVGPALAPGTELEPGDLVFFGTGPGDVQHVGIVASPGVMVDAAHTGTTVRTEPFATTPGGTWGGEAFVGATRPG
jgi:cell wall-associated NlpC family hydrolase